MVGNTLSSWRVAFALLLICQYVYSNPDVTIYTPKNQKNYEVVQENKTSKSVIESDVKPDGPTDQPPINPMILPKNRQHLRFYQRDSYLSALQYSHTMLQKEASNQPSKQQLTRREYTPGPVYRGDGNNNSSGSSDAASNSNKFVVPEIQGKISRISTYNPSSSSYQPSVVISSHDPIPPSYHNYETYETYSPPSYSPSQSFNSYGPPSSSYGTPSNAYGQPGFSSYGASHHGHSNYGAPPPSQGEGKGLGSLQATYSTSYPLPDLFPLALMPSLDLSWPISLKLNAYTVIKIILKIIVFKMIVKFIATICLLLFLPKMMQGKPEHSSSDDDEESRKFDDKPNAKRLHLLKSMVTKSIEHYENLNKKEEEGTKSNEEACTTIGCKVRSKLSFLTNDTWDDYVRLFKSYLDEERGRDETFPNSDGNRSRR